MILCQQKGSSLCPPHRRRANAKSKVLTLVLKPKVSAPEQMKCVKEKQDLLGDIRKVKVPHGEKERAWFAKKDRVPPCLERRGGRGRPPGASDIL